MVRNNKTDDPLGRGGLASRGGPPSGPSISTRPPMDVQSAPFPSCPWEGRRDHVGADRLGLIGLSGPSVTVPFG